MRQFKWSLCSRNLFKWFQDAPPETLTDIQRAARFYYLQRHAFGGKIESQSWGTRTTHPPVNLLSIEESLSAAHLRLSNSYIENMDWHECMTRYDREHTFFYLDPPYLETGGYGVTFGIDEYQKMADKLKTIKGKAIVSLNDHPEIRRIFADFEMDVVPIKYTINDANFVDRNELIIYNWDRTLDPVGLF